MIGLKIYPEQTMLLLQRLDSILNYCTRRYNKQPFKDKYKFNKP